MDGCMAEVTVEAGRPDTIDREKLRAIKEFAGRAQRLRICINPQSMNAGTLRLIGRGHTPDEVRDAFRLAREMGFAEINMDIIAGLPGEDAGMFANTLEELAKLNPDSVSVHTLAIKRASSLNENRDRFAYPDEAAVAEMTDMAARFASQCDMKPYYLYRQKNMLGKLENIGYAINGCECVYNMHQMGDTIDILAAGAGAVTKLIFKEQNRIERVFNLKNLREYIARADEMLEKKKRVLNTYGRL
jgi:oxygen-independent coproporphyrinogen-3 oxidase